MALLRIGKKHTIAWEGADQAYWIVFTGNGTPATPISLDTVAVPNGRQTGPYDIVIPPDKANYFKYEIHFDDGHGHPGPICKTADNERDTGMNVKR